MKLYQIVFLILLITACGRNKNNQPLSNSTPSNIKAFEVKEIVQTSKYTYLKVYENFADRWIAVSRMDAAIGDKYYYDSALLMTNFHSKELNRDFETIYFINRVSTSPIAVHTKNSATSPPLSGKKKVQEHNKVSIEKSREKLR